MWYLVPHLALYQFFLSLLAGKGCCSGTHAHTHTHPTAQQPYSMMWDNVANFDAALLASWTACSAIPVHRQPVFHIKSPYGDHSFWEDSMLRQLRISLRKQKKHWTRAPKESMQQRRCSGLNICMPMSIYKSILFLCPLIKVQTGTCWDHWFPQQYFHFVSNKPNLKFWFKLNILKINLS